MIATVMSSLALMAAVGCTVLTLRERKRSRERSAAQNGMWAEALSKVQGQVEELTNGAVPDYEKAKAAAKAVDDLHVGIANVLSYDPYEAIRRGSDNGGGTA